MTSPNSAVQRPGTPSQRLSAAALLRMAVLAAVLLGVMALAVALCLVWLGGDAPDLYTRSSIGIERALPRVDPMSATVRATAARLSR
jgi:hypothetical protein